MCREMTVGVALAQGADRAEIVIAAVKTMDSGVRRRDGALAGVAAKVARRHRGGLRQASALDSLRHCGPRLSVNFVPVD
jgi:hypothetical protein